MSKRSRANGQRRRLMREAGGRCALCEAIFPLMKAHITPRGQGSRGTRADDSDENLILLCNPCEQKVEGAAISRDRLREQKSELVARPRSYGWPIGGAFLFQIGGNVLHGDGTLLGVDHHRVIWRDPEAVGTGLCADFRDRSDRVVVRIRDGVWESGYVYSCEAKPVGERSYRFWLTAATDLNQARKDKAELEFAVDECVLRVETARFWASGLRVDVRAQVFGTIENVAFRAGGRPVVWLYTRNYVGVQGRALFEKALR